MGPWLGVKQCCEKWGRSREKNVKKYSEMGNTILGLMDEMWAGTKEGVKANIIDSHINFHSANKM